MIKQPVGGRPLALIDLKVINFLAFLAKHENNFDVPGVACGAPTTPNLLHSLAHHITRSCALRHTAAVSRARGNAKPLLVKTESQQ